MQAPLLFESEALVEYLGGDRLFAAEMIDFFFHDSADNMSGIRDAAAARDFSRLYEFLHALKGNAANIQAPPLRDFVQRMALAAKAGEAAALEMLPQLEQEYARSCEALRAWQEAARGK